MTKKPVCTAIRKDGKPCTLPALASTGELFCFAHNPESVDAKRRGGRNKANVIRLGKLSPPQMTALYAELLQVFEHVKEGKLTPQVGNSLATIAGAMVKTLSAGDFEQRLRDLEALRQQGPLGRRAG